MAEVSRTEKINAARKKLDKFKKDRNQSNTSSFASSRKSSFGSNSNLDTAAKLTVCPISEQKFDSHPPVIIDQSATLKHPQGLSEFNDNYTSSAESLRQITVQLNGLIEQESLSLANSDTVQNNGTSFQERNIELASSLEKYKKINEQLAWELREQRENQDRAQAEVEKERSQLLHDIQQENATLQQQLHVHVQTIGVLVAEKTELQSVLTQTQHSVKQKTSEVEELQSRLKISRQRVSELEKELANTSSENTQSSRAIKEVGKDFDRLKLDHSRTRKELEEVKQQKAELTKRFTEVTSLYEKQKIDLGSVQKRLNMAEQYANQLKSTEEDKRGKDIDDLTKQNKLLEDKVVQMHTDLNQLRSEKERLIRESNSHSDSLISKLNNLAQDITSVREQNEHLINQNKMLSSAVEENERLLDQERSRVATEGDSIKGDLQSLAGEMSRVRSENAELNTAVESLKQENRKLCEALEQKEMSIASIQAEYCNSEIQRQNEKLLETSESSKVAASRAVTQNQDLKKQLGELQDGFVKMSNDKLILTEKLETEQFVTKELSDRLLQQEEELKDCRDELADKKKELRMKDKSSAELTKEMYSHQQILDRVRHYEAQGQIAEKLQEELRRAQEQVQLLTKQNSELRTTLSMQLNNNDVIPKADLNASRQEDLVASLSASVRQLEAERNELMSKLKHNHPLQNGAIDRCENESGDKASHWAMHTLEDKLQRTMRQIAELSEEKQFLEHTILQLQHETETIGEYITLYQIQRKHLKEKAIEKDDYITSIARDKEELRNKLSELQELVMQMLVENKQFKTHSDTFQEQGDRSAVPSQDTPLVHRNQSASDRIVNLISQINSTAAAVSSPGELAATCPHPQQSLPDMNFHPCPLCSGVLIHV